MMMRWGMLIYRRHGSVSGPEIAGAGVRVHHRLTAAFTSLNTLRIPQSDYVVGTGVSKTMLRADASIFVFARVHQRTRIAVCLSGVSRPYWTGAAWQEF